MRIAIIAAQNSLSRIREIDPVTSVSPNTCPMPI